MTRLLRLRPILILLGVLTAPAPVLAYVEAPHSLGAIIHQSSTICLMQVEKVDKTNNQIIYRKVRDLKGKHPQDVIKHNIGRAGFHPREWQYPMEWAEVGKMAVFCYNGNASETCIGNYWYQAYQNGEWWGMSHGEPFLLRSFAGRVEKFADLVTEVLAGKEVLAPCMVDGNKDDLHLRRARIQRLRVSLKLLDYNPKRDFAGWGGEDFRRLSGMPGFTHYSSISRVDPDAQAISSADFNNDGKPDLVLAGSSRIALLTNGGESLNDTSLPGLSGGCRAAVWADYNGDGKPDLLLATPNGPKLYTNTGDGFRDDSHLLPVEPGYNLTAAAWMDYDGDGRPDLLLGNGFHGLRLYRNTGKPEGKTDPIRVSAWSYIGPFDNAGNKGFDTAYPPEKELDLTKTYPGRNNEPAAWKEGKFTDGEINNLALFRPENNSDAVVYLHRRIDCAAPMELPLSLGSDDALTVWLNGEKILSENVARACAPDQNRTTLKLRKGANDLLMKVCQGGGEWAFYYRPEAMIPPPITWSFEDVSDRVGLGAEGIGSTSKGDTLAVCDVNGDGRPDFLYGSGKGLLVLNTPQGFRESADSGIAYRPGGVGPVFGDFDGDGHPDLFVPQEGGCKLFRNNGDGRFTDVTEKSGDLAAFTGHATSAAWGDLDNDGVLDLMVGCLRGANRWFRGRGDGTFQDATAALGLEGRIFNTQAVGLVDLNGDGVLDVVFNNEGQESCVLLGNPEFAAKKTPVTLQIAGVGVVGSRVRILTTEGKLVGGLELRGGEARGGQANPSARFALSPGTYRVEVRYSTGLVRAKEIIVASSHLKGVIDEQTPELK